MRNIVKDHNLKDEFIAFRKQCIWFRCCYNTYHTLFESGQYTTRLLENAAVLFFADLNIIFIEYCWLQICKLTDPASSQGRDNLTIKYFHKKLADLGLMTPAINESAKAIFAYRELLKTGRNRLVSHLDKETVLLGNDVGVHRAEDVEAFLLQLQIYVDLVAGAVGDGPCDFSSTAGEGDVTDLLLILKQALHPFIDSERLE